MKNWIEILSMGDSELLDDFYAKVNEDEEIYEEKRAKRDCRKLRDNAWTRKRAYRKKMVREFLSLNPGMKIEYIHPLRSLNAIFIDDEISTNGGLYNINHVSHVYITPRGHFEIFRGKLEWGFNGRIFGMGCKDRDAAAIINRRIRHMAMDDECNMKYSDCKKKFAPKNGGIL